MRTIPTMILFLLMSGCAMMGAERSELPDGVTLMETMHGSCDATIAIEDNIEVRPGQSTVVQVDEYEDIEWACLDRRDYDEDEFDCPPGTDYLRVIREQGDDDFTVECFG